MGYNARGKCDGTGPYKGSRRRRKGKKAGRRRGTCK